MKKGYFVWLLAFLAVFMLSACNDKAGNEGSSEEHTESSAEEPADNNAKTGGIQMQELIINVGGQQFQATLYDNETAHALGNGTVEVSFEAGE